METEKACISCGMPLKESSHFPLGDSSKEYCVHCANQDGSLKTFDEALSGMTDFIVNEAGVTEYEARRKAYSILTQNPAWKNHKN
ncbi:MAG: zinc ribbon domain-containing protein [Bdellovibrionaceae bacterium]|nr:zinc ribbon domain-containing protein [Bdellovibrionales bacterium]MCB9084336.1 zinc ribbon domain-containing protein [Pseudobdellovibrionaceae bacterium]